MAAGAAPAADVKELLCARWPGRREQISQLLGLIGEPHDHAMPMFVHGPPVTGKTSIVRDVLGTLGRPFAYTSLVDSHGPRLLLDALVEELAPHLRGVDEKDLRCDRMADLVSILRRGLPRRQPGGVRGHRRGHEAFGLERRGLNAPGAHEALRAHGAERGVRACRHPGLGRVPQRGGARPPAPVFFDAYSKAQLQKVLLRERPPEADERLYGNFVASILPVYVATCKSLHELRALLQPLWRVYVEPWERARDAAKEAAETGKGRDGDDGNGVSIVPPPRLPEARQLFAMLQSGAGAAPGNGEASERAERASGLNTHRRRARRAWPVGGRRRRRDGRPRDAAAPSLLRAGTPRRPRGALSSAALALGRGEWPVEEDAGAGAGKLDFDIPRLTKFMLVSAHLATMNRESVDRRLFGHMVEGTRAGTTASRGGGKRRRGGAAADRQQDQASTAALEGPGAFNLERLLAYFRIVTKQAYDEDDAGSEELARELLSADVFMQISSMVALGLLTRVSGATRSTRCGTGAT